ncbi:MAG TPA: fatty acid--CoA ligase family protein [Trebonia sp.]|jgi:acyl-CoA synthetase (AMP-forming)/AMP-acid ligase II|nr:fatty acid--CoA ligase family protein [Trebonia sp.]
MPGWSTGVVAAYDGSDRPAVISADRTVTGRGLLAAAAGAAGWFESFGLASGAPLPALVTTSADTLALLLAGAAAGHPLAPLGPRLTAAELSGAVRGLGSRVLLYEPAFAGLAAELGQLTGVEAVRVAHLPDGSDVARLAAPGVDAVAACLHTGGTTGAPKPVALTQRVLSNRSAVLAGLTGMAGPDAVYATGSPVHHIGGLGNILAALSVGATVVAAASFSAGWWRGLRAHGVTHALLVPSMIEMLLSEGALDAVPLRTLIYGASPIRPATLARVLALLPGIRMVNLFGQTEGSPITCLTPADHALAIAGRPELLRSVGRPVPGLDLRIDAPDEAGAGEVLARAAHLSRPGPDGWLRTGDIGRQDAGGYLYLVGRTHDRIVRGGENVYPAEVEGVLESHPGVAAAGVTGVPDERLGQTIAAFVIPADAADPPDPQALRQYARERLAGFKVPAYWYPVGSLPHSAAGKLLRRELASWHADRVAPASPPGDGASLRGQADI